MVWFNNWLGGKSCISVKDLTATEQDVRRTIREVIEFMRRICPIGFKDAYLYDIAPQTGVRCSRRLKGEYIMTVEDFAFHREFDDVIAWHSTICRINDSAPIEIPYRAILPQKVENLLCPGRHLSSDNVAIDWLNLIPQCVGTGQAAGIAAAVALSDGTSVRNVDIKKVQDILVAQDVPLPRRRDVDPVLTEVVRNTNMVFTPNWQRRPRRIFLLWMRIASLDKRNRRETMKIIRGINRFFTWVCMVLIAALMLLMVAEF